MFDFSDLVPRTLYARHQAKSFFDTLAIAAGGNEWHAELP
jgi:hypothetical protein